VSLSVPTFNAVVADVCRSLARHGFREIFLCCSHGGNYPVLRNLVARIREEHPTLRIRAKTDWDTEGTKQFVARESVNTARMGLHAGLSETSRMLACRPDLVQMDKARERFMGDLSPYLPEFNRSGYFPPFDTISPTGILGDARESTRELGEKQLDHEIERFVVMMEAGAFG